MSNLNLFAPPVALEQIDLLSGKFKKICNFSVK